MSTILDYTATEDTTDGNARAAIADRESQAFEGAFSPIEINPDYVLDDCNEDDENESATGYGYGATDAELNALIRRVENGEIQ